MDFEAVATGFAVREGLKWAARGAIVYCEYRVAKAKTDGRDDWEDGFWLKLLERLDRYRADAARQGK